MQKVTMGNKDTIGEHPVIYAQQSYSSGLTSTITAHL